VVSNVDCRWGNVIGSKPSPVLGDALGFSGAVGVMSIVGVDSLSIASGTAVATTGFGKSVDAGGSAESLPVPALGYSSTLALGSAEICSPACPFMDTDCGDFCSETGDNRTGAACAGFSLAGGGLGCTAALGLGEVGGESMAAGCG
jgi:hypothetical protein